MDKWYKPPATTVLMQMGWCLFNVEVCGLTGISRVACLVFPWFTHSARDACALRCG